MTSSAVAAVDWRGVQGKPGEANYQLPSGPISAMGIAQPPPVGYSPLHTRKLKQSQKVHPRETDAGSPKPKLKNNWAALDPLEFPDKLKHINDHQRLYSALY
eukprot:GHVT01014055.1.p2 GENE.GHVT01014055.1~~GHVT01014055.1.p2  ORF type:complete len:102 (+),score=10.87 GHVT01014055.1:131-436(+)